MRFFSPLNPLFLRKSVLIIAAVTTITACGRSLPELPTELGPPTTPTAPRPPAPPTPTVQAPPTPTVQTPPTPTVQAPSTNDVPTPPVAAVPGPGAAPEPRSVAGANPGFISQGNTGQGTAGQATAGRATTGQSSTGLGSTGQTSVGQNSTPGTLGFDVLHKANFNPFDLDNGKSFRTLSTADIYRSELGRHSIESIKPVDFNTSQVLVSSAGEKPTGGFTISVTDIEDMADKVVVTVVQTIPGPSCVTTQARSHPYEFVLIPSTKPIEIFERQRIDNC